MSSLASHILSGLAASIVVAPDSRAEDDRAVATRRGDRWQRQYHQPAKDAHDDRIINVT